MTSNPTERTDYRYGVDLDDLGSTLRKTVLIIDDDPDTVVLLKHILRTAGFNVMGAYEGQEALDKVASHPPDIVLLDIMMPEMDGREVFRRMRDMVDLPVIYITALNKKEQIVNGLKDGVDDYITKPFYNEEVVERVRVVLRRAGSSTELNRFIFPHIDLVIDLRGHQVVYCGERIHFPPKEFEFLSLLARNTPTVVDYQKIGDVIWGIQSPNIRKRTNYMVYLIRQKFKKVSPDADFITNIDRVGYKLKVD